MVLLLYLGISAKGRTAYTKRYECIYHVGVPLLIFFSFLTVIFLMGWNWIALFSFVGVLGNCAYAVINYNNDSFLNLTLSLKPLQRRSIFLYYYIDSNDEWDVQVYQWQKHSTSFMTVVKIVEDNKLDQQERGQFESEEKWEQYCKFKKAYAEHKKTADQYSVEVLGFYDIIEGFKQLIYVHPGKLNDHVLEGNAVKIAEQVDIEGRKFEKIICFEGKEDVDVQLHLGSAVGYLDILNSLPLLAAIPNMQLQIVALQQMNKDQRDTMEKNKWQVMLADEYVKYNTPTTQEFDMKPVMKLIIYSIVAAIGLVATFILLSILGVI